jgi:predicted MPP superfamily phosphohydrolase
MKSKTDHHASSTGRRHHSPTHEPSRKSKTSSKFKRAKIRHFLFTVGPDRLMRGRIRRRHMAQNILPREIEITSPRWPAAFDGLRIAHVSDFHLGDLLPLDRALDIIHQVAELEPDMLACTGDVVDLHHHEAAPLLKAMADVAAPMGTALVLGNHDELQCGETVANLARDAGVNVLRNDVLTVNHHGRTLNVAGVRWAKSVKACAKNIDATCPDGCDLLLSHNPKSFHRAAQRGIPLTLAGHTHGGQIAMRNRPGIGLGAAHRLRAGLYSEGDSRLFVTTGVGAWFPLRINVPAEIAMITMRSQPRE